MKKLRTLSILVLILSSLSLMGIGCKGGDPEAQARGSQRVPLQWWGVEESEAALRKLATSYKELHPNVSLTFRSFRAEELEQAVVQALAAGRGPDIVSIPNNAVRAWQERLTPLPPTTTLPALELSGVFKKEQLWVLKKQPSLTLSDLKQSFADVVVGDAVVNQKIYGLPLSVDSLLLYYNRDLLNAANLPEPPATWSEFKDAVTKITKLDSRGALVQNGAALGEADNVPYVADLVAALMLQNGTTMVDSNGTNAAFGGHTGSGSQAYSPGADALRFYTDFANPAKETYSWSKDEPNAFQAFAAGKVAFVFGYWRDKAKLTALAPRITIGVANFPQIEGTLKPSYYASYYLTTVTKQSKFSNEAWDLLQFIASGERIEQYLKSTQQPAASRRIITTQQQDVTLGVAAKQVLSARSWYHGFQPNIVQAAFQAMVKRVQTGTGLQEALDFAQNQVTQTLRNYGQ